MRRQRRRPGPAPWRAWPASSPCEARALPTSACLLDVHPSMSCTEDRASFDPLHGSMLHHRFSNRCTPYTIFCSLARFDRRCDRGAATLLPCLHAHPSMPLCSWRRFFAACMLVQGCRCACGDSVVHARTQSGLAAARRQRQRHRLTGDAHPALGRALDRVRRH